MFVRDFDDSEDYNMSEDIKDPNQDLKESNISLFLFVTQCHSTSSDENTSDNDHPEPEKNIYLWMLRDLLKT